MNDKCAAGTGRFLGAASYALEMSLSELGPLALKSESPVRITTTCTVFAESEIISHLSKGILPEDVLMGVHQAITSRCVSLARRVGIESEVTFTGGVSRNVAMVKLIEDACGMKINISPDAHFCGALGAALYALERVQQGVTTPDTQTTTAVA
jgi:predicted CoA-substrate-specific enzyme activase